MDDFRYPGHFEVDGIVYVGMLDKGAFPRIKTDLKLDNSDVVVCGYPRSGTTWTTEIVHNVIVGPEKARSGFASMDEFAPYIEAAPVLENQKSSFDELLQSPRPWHIRTHLYAKYYEHFFDGTDGPKFVYVLRNPKDVLVSLYMNHKDLDIGGLTWKDFLELFRRKKVWFGDVFDHQLSWWKYREHPNLLIVHYEDMLTQPKREFARIAQYLGRSYSEEEIEGIVANTSFAKMVARPMQDYFRHLPEKEHSRKGVIIRKGKMGGWKEMFTDAQNAELDSIYEEKLTPVGLIHRT